MWINEFGGNEKLRQSKLADPSIPKLLYKELKDLER